MCPTSQLSHSTTMHPWPALKWLYLATTALSAFMVVWILIMPSSWLIGRSKWHDDLLLSALDEDSPTPPHILTKYAGHTAVHLTHVLPGAIWAGLVPLQLHPTLRKTRSQLHRLSGYVFLCSSLLMSVGVFIIFKRDLLFESFFDVPGTDQELIPTKPFLGLLTLYFAGTALAALRAARDRKFQAHRAWIIRHIASGIWIALQRFLLMTVCQVIYISSRPVPATSQRNAFRNAAFISIGICLVVGEYTVYLWKQQQKASNNKKLG